MPNSVNRQGIRSHTALLAPFQPLNNTFYVFITWVAECIKGKLNSGVVQTVIHFPSNFCCSLSTTLQTQIFGRNWKKGLSLLADGWINSSWRLA